MPFKNLIDNSSTTVSSATPGATLDMRFRTTLGRASQGVPVRARIKATSSSDGDSGAVKLLDENGAAVLTVNITGSTARWYVQDGYLPASIAKYDWHYGGNTAGTLTVQSTCLYEWCDVPDLNGSLSASIGEITLSAAGTNVETGTINGELSQSIGDITLSAAGETGRLGELSASIGAITLAAEGTNGTTTLNGELSQSIGNITLSAAGVGWTIDATSGVAMPKNASEYTAWRTANSLTAFNNPSDFFDGIDGGSGNLASINGSRTFTNSGAGESFGNAVPGWTATGAKLTDGSGAVSWDFAGENLSTTAVAAFVILDLNTLASRDLLSFGGSSSTDSTGVAINGSGNIIATRGSNTATSSSTYSGVVAIFAVCRAGSSNYSVYVKPVGGSMETLTPTWAAPPNATHTNYLSTGWSPGLSTDATIVRYEYWTGTGAQFSSTNVSDFFTARGI